MIAEGKYRARALQADLGEAGTGTEQAGVEFEITEECYDQGAHITGYFYFTSDAQAEFSIKALRAAGWKGDDIADLSSIDGSAECVIVIEHEEYNGNITAKVKYVNALGAGLAMKTRLPPDKRRAFADRMRGLVLASNGGKPSTSVPPSRTPKRSETQHPNAPGSDDMRPFSASDDDIPW